MPNLAPRTIPNPHFLLILTALGWAGNAIAGKYALGHISPMALTFLRWCFALAVLLPFSWRFVRADWKLIRENIPYLILMGGFGYTVFNISLYSALHFTSAMNVTIEQTAMPLFIFAMNFALYRARVSVWPPLGYGLTFIGVLVTATHGAPLAFFEKGLSGFNIGDAIMIFGGLFYAAHCIGLTRKPAIHPLSFLTALTLGAILFAAFAALYEELAGQSQWPQTAEAFGVIAYTGIVPALVSQGFFVYGVAALGANRASLYINLVPVFAALMAVFLLGESLHPYHFLAFALVAGGLFIASKGARGAIADKPPV